MQIPEMILFDYGQTLFDEQPFDGIRGTQAVLDNCVETPVQVTAGEVQEFADLLNKDIGRFVPGKPDLINLEIHNHQFQNYLYEYFGLKLKVSPLELETIFWDAALPPKLTRNIDKFLLYLQENRIRTGVISNISFSGEALKNRINRFLPNNSFEFIIATSEYVFRKPHKRIFELALRKAGLQADAVWYCGDNAVYDIDGASNAGLTPVWYKGALREDSLVPQVGCLAVNDWDDLICVLEKLRG